VSETDQPKSDQDPAPIEHSDAERVTGEEADEDRESTAGDGEADEDDDG
jgi:hypothetical protein